MCVTPGDSRAAGIPKPLAPAEHDLPEGGWGENSGIQKSPKCMIWWKNTVQAA